MEAKNFKPGQVWSNRVEQPVGIESLADDGSIMLVYGRNLTTGAAQSFTIEGSYHATAHKSDYDLMELVREADTDAESAEFVTAGKTPDALNSALEKLLGCADKAIADSKEASERHFADCMIIAALEGGALRTFAAEEIMQQIQRIIDLRRELHV